MSMNQWNKIVCTSDSKLCYNIIKYNNRKGIVNMTLYDFINMAIDNYYNCYIWDSKKGENVFEGEISGIPDELLEHEIASWEIKNDKIGFNID